MKHSPARRPVPPDFFERDARQVARALIGMHLIRIRGGETLPPETLVARIVETEAYRGPGDAACHARFGVTRRTRAIFSAPGHAYVFRIYGMHDCFNVTCLREDSGHAVLVRAVEPAAGLVGQRTDGPGRLTRALGITRADFDGRSVCDVSSGLWVAGPNAGASPATEPCIQTSARVGVAYAGDIAEAKWRFFDAASHFVSRPSPRTVGLGEGGPVEAQGRARRERPER